MALPQLLSGAALAGGAPARQPREAAEGPNGDHRSKPPSRPRSDRAVVFACDGRYLPYALFAAEQIARLHPARDFDICLCALGETPRPAARASRRSGCGSAGSRRAGRWPGCRSTRGGARRPISGCASRRLRRRLPAAALSRLGRLRSGRRLRRADAGSDLGARAVAAVRDNFQWRNPRRHADSFRAMKLPNGAVLQRRGAADRRRRLRGGGDRRALRRLRGGASGGRCCTWTRTCSTAR